MPFLGELAALSTAVLWSLTSLFFTSASRRIGSYWLNKIRILFAAILLGITLFLTTGHLLPPGITSRSYILLILSGIIGLSMGDACLFQAYVIIGPRLSLLIFTVWPIIAAVTAWIFLGESLGFQAIIGILITVAGMVWVTAERNTNGNQISHSERKRIKLGIILALGGAAGQAIGLVLAKAGMGDTLLPLPATFIRMLAAVVAIWLFGIVRGDLRDFKSKFADKRAVLLAFGGAIVGPFLGVWMSLVAVQHTKTGVAAAIMSTVPVLVIPLVIIFYKEKVSPRAIIGAVITVAGVALLFLR
ncbi:conserved membrane hypothetical protein [Candidatus Zixiibacteriota bacterium]|nr:conserved membrane hypothetical protein [candidate division Zixibacteria bacterium]